MRPALAPARLLHRLPAYAVNGISVALGIGAVHLLIGGVAGAAAAQFAGSAAVCTSLSDLPNTVGRTWQRVLAAALLSSATALMVALLAHHPLALGVGVMAVAFGSMMTMAWGLRAGPISFAPILALVFSMAVPRDSYDVLEFFGWNVAGALVYVLWSVLTVRLLQRHYRRLALLAALHGAAGLLRSRSGMLEAPRAMARGQFKLNNWIADEARLAERLQAARDLLFAAADGPRSRRDTAMLLHTIDLRDVLLASRLDLDLLGNDAVAELVLDRVGSGLRSIATALDALADEMRDRTLGPAFGIEPAPRLLFADAPVAASDPRVRILPAIAGRLQNLADNVVAIHALALGHEESLPLSREQLQRFVGPEAWPLKALRSQLTTASPVLRHALRMSLALGTAFFTAPLLPWASHPHWLVLSVAVVLRGNLEQTLTRRNARILGTVFGCLLVLLFVQPRSAALVEGVFLIAVGLAHSFVNVRYWITATAATVMALLQSHLADPAAGFAVAERLADTVLGAALGWGFSYVLPSWERHTIPQALARALGALDNYARRVLTLEGEAAVEQRLARRGAYDALSAVAAAAQRSAVEPKRARLPVGEMTTFLDHGQRLMAHLSSVRLVLARGAAALRDPSVVVALRNASVEVSASLAPQDGAGATPAPQPTARWTDALPGEPPATDPLPWLLRRLQLSVDDAHRIRAAARAALARLA